ncbi:hypothetical protein [Streptomyces sp. NPDC007346]
MNASKDTKNKKEKGFIRKAEYRPSLCSPLERDVLPIYVESPSTGWA